MQKLVELRKDEVFTNSKVIAEGTNVKHHAVQQIISKYEDDFSDFGQVAFEMRAVKYDRGTNQEKIYLLNEQQATLLMTYMRNSEITRKFKKELVRQFYAMRQFIFERQSKGWVQARENSKITRKEETDILDKLIEYAREQGFDRDDKVLYMNYSRLANKICGISDRDFATTEQLTNLTVAENIILHCIQLGIDGDKYYKDIYQDCKKRLEMFKDIAYLEVA